MVDHHEMVTAVPVEICHVTVIVRVLSQMCGRGYTWYHPKKTVYSGGRLKRDSPNMAPLNGDQLRMSRLCSPMLWQTYDWLITPSKSAILATGLGPFRKNQPCILTCNDMHT